MYSVYTTFLRDDNSVKIVGRFSSLEEATNKFLDITKGFSKIQIRSWIERNDVKPENIVVVTSYVSAHLEGNTWITTVSMEERNGDTKRIRGKMELHNDDAYEYLVNRNLIEENQDMKPLDSVVVSEEIYIRGQDDEALRKLSWSSFY